MRLCLDLNVWCGAFIARRLGRSDTATIALAELVRLGQSPRGPLSLVVSWGMLERLSAVLVRDLGFATADAARLAELIASYAKDGPSLTLGGLGVIPVHDVEDRHVLETAWAGRADVFATANLRDFLGEESGIVRAGRVYRLRRGDRTMVMAHPFDVLHWLRGGAWEINPGEP